MTMKEARMEKGASMTCCFTPTPVENSAPSAETTPSMAARPCRESRISKRVDCLPPAARALQQFRAEQSLQICSQNSGSSVCCSMSESAGNSLVPHVDGLWCWAIEGLCLCEGWWPVLADVCSHLSCFVGDVAGLDVLNLAAVDLDVVLHVPKDQPTSSGLVAGMPSILTVQGSLPWHRSVRPWLASRRPQHERLLSDAGAAEAGWEMPHESRGPGRVH